MIKYLGSKRLLVPAIVAAARALPGARTGLDLFAGTTRVAQGWKAAGLRVHANDTASYSEVLARCYIETDGGAIRAKDVRQLLDHLQSVPPRAGYLTDTFCKLSRYFHPKNGARIDAIRAEIDALDLGPAMRAIALTSLLEAADRVDSTTGLQMAYLKEWAPRALGDLELRPPHLLDGWGSVSRDDANLLVRRMKEVDCAYIDPPYNQHSFYRNYHVWETLVRNDAPEVYGVACKRLDCRGHRSAYNSRRTFQETLRDLFEHLRSCWVILSCSSEGYLDPDDAPALLRRWGGVVGIEIDSKRYVGAQIGIHNLRGEKVGQVSHLRNREYLFLAGEDRRALRSAAAAAAEAVRADGRRARILRQNRRSGRPPRDLQVP
jgi:adenine-specific DNA-methyltransferase